MFRTLCSRVNSSLPLQDIYKPLFQNNECFKTLNIRKSKLYSSCYCSALYLNDENKKESNGTVPLYNTCRKTFHTNSLNYQQFKTSALDFNKASINFFNIRMEDLKLAPLPSFWIGMVGLTPLVFPPITSIIIGYSHFLSSAQFLYAAALLSCMGGIKWGSLIQNKEDGTWENYALSVVPCIIAIFSLCMPKFLGYLVLIFGFLAAFVIDLTTSNYPKWFISLRGVLTNISVFFLIISMLQSLLH